MAQIFTPKANLYARLSILGVVLVLVGLAGLADLLNRSPVFRRARSAREQPVPFSHKHHVQVLGIDCRYCHTTVEDAPFAGMPPLRTCMNCHAKVWTNAVVLARVRDAYAAQTPLPWTRVTDLPDFVRFDHSIHTHKGIGCVSCHGDVAAMPLTWRVENLTMSWCLDCHRHPENHVRPRDALVDAQWAPPADQPHLRAQILAQYAIRRETGCGICHQ